MGVNLKDKIVNNEAIMIKVNIEFSNRFCFFPYKKQNKITNNRIE